MNYENIFDKDTLKAMKKLALGMEVEEVVSEYVVEDGKKVLVKQKVNKKTLPPNTDIIKMLYSANQNKEYSLKSLTDEELEEEKKRLLQALKEEEDANRKDKSKNKV